jgi:polysaccharide export outer membrane protein
VRSTAALTCLLLVGAAGCGHAPDTVEASLLTPQAELALGPGDTFDIRVFGEADLSNTYRVAADGTIDYPLLGQLKVEGLDPHAVAALIEGKLSEKFLKHPQVSILVKDQSSKKIIIIGQVAKPGTYTFAPNMSVVEAITLAGGFTPIAAKNQTTITRVERGEKFSIEVPVASIGEGKARNVMLRPGDMISVPERIF